MERNSGGEPSTRCDHHDSHRHRVPIAIGTGALLAGALGYIGFTNPHDPQSVYPQCPFKMLTGWNCPFCGGLRMMYDLLHGDLPASINDNLFALLGIPLLVGCVLMRRHQDRTVLPFGAVLTIVAVTVAWTVLRNLPGFPLIPTVLGG
ncbi:membrane protein [Mycobacterium rhizamassiliense]|jgi:hypothetical protein|uniref:Membrane protein n=1 Tax=Mycobacterium rhizamassiliense TaxID=1841860 RepID=A0A2U3NZU0_9MYCO|nr:DUF2752 domain-containing protein [Mycobacterium rhizamassiliense]SPM36988.1 membrane protein [Mycobacterium rhizamassiliense]